jgi:hypothetical protein
MMTEALHKVLRGWVRVGILFNAQDAARTPDIEELLLHTARVAGQSANLVVCVTSWLALRGDFVCKHRLARCIRASLDVADQPAMGLMLEQAQMLRGGKSMSFNAAMAACAPAETGVPLLEAERGNGKRARFAELGASDVSRRWGRWLETFEAREEVMRPAGWIARHNPSLALRALVGGDLVASILAEHEASGAGTAGFASEMELSRRCGVTRMAIRHALDRLEMAGMATRRREGRNVRIEIHARVPAG